MVGHVALPLLIALAPAEPPAAAGKGVVIRPADKPTFSILGGQSKARILLDDEIVPGLTEAAMTELELGPGATVPEHVHDTSEWLYVLEGEGTMTMGGEKMAVRAPAAIYIPAGVKHGLLMAPGAKPLRAIQFYVPGGPQKRFRNAPPAKEKK